MSSNVSPRDIHPGWHRLTDLLQKNFLTRRRFFPAAGAIGAAAMMPSLIRGSRAASAHRAADQASWSSNNKIKHVVILCQENRSFDHYFGHFASTLGSGTDTAEGFQTKNVVYRDGHGNKFHPYHLTQYCDLDPDHSWEGSHTKWNHGAMDGFVRAEGGQTTALGFFEQPDHIYHVNLAHAFTLADHYFCSQIGPTLPNRLYLWSGTSGWDYLNPTSTSNSLPFNNPSLAAPPPVLNWPTMADVLDTAGLPWKCYSVADGSVPSAIGAFNPLIFFQSMLTSPTKLANATAEISEFFIDLAAGTLPAVSWIVTEAAVCEHPPAPPDMGQLLVARVVDALKQSSAWDSSVLFVTYDEGGGFFDTVPPTVLEYVPGNLPDANRAVGPAFRVPMFIVSPYAQRNRIYKRPLDHTSILQFIEQTFTTTAAPVMLNSINPARRRLDYLASALDFNHNPNTPVLPTAAQLYGQANKTVLTLNGQNTVASCSTALPSWLPQLLGV